MEFAQRNDMESQEMDGYDEFAFEVSEAEGSLERVSGSDGSVSPGRISNPPARNSNIQIRPNSSFSRTEADNWCPPASTTSEQNALQVILTEKVKSGADLRNINIQLTDFEIYKAPNAVRGEYELLPLHYFGTKAKDLCFSGFLVAEMSLYFYVYFFRVSRLCIWICMVHGVIMIEGMNCISSSRRFSLKS